MFLTQQIKEMHLPHAEKNVANFLLDQGSLIKDLSTRQIAAATYTTPATLVRLGQRMGFEGWTDFFKKYMEETNYLERNFRKIDANCPFTAADTQIVISNKIGTLYQEVVTDTIELLDYKMLDKINACLLRSRVIYLAGFSLSLDCTWLFKHKMGRLGKTVIMEQSNGEQSYQLRTASQEDCVLVVSYSGSNVQVVEEMKLLKKNKVPIILLSGLGDSPARSLSTYQLTMTTRERLYSKIGNFSTEVSVHLLLDIIYSCYFASDYEKNWTCKHNDAAKIERYRSTDNQIMKE